MIATESSPVVGMPAMRLGQISERLGFIVTAELLASLGFSPCGRERAAVLYGSSDFPLICAALVRRVRAAQAAFAEQAA